MPTLHQIADEYVDRLSALDPLAATSMGVPGHDHEVPDFSPDGAQARAALDAETLTALEAAPAAAARDRLARDVMAERLVLSRELFEAGRASPRPEHHRLAHAAPARGLRSDADQDGWRLGEHRGADGGGAPGVARHAGVAGGGPRCGTDRRRAAGPRDDRAGADLGRLRRRAVRLLRGADREAGRAVAGGAGVAPAGRSGDGVGGLCRLGRLPGGGVPARRPVRRRRGRGAVRAAGARLHWAAPGPPGDIRLGLGGTATHPGRDDRDRRSDRAGRQPGGCGAAAGDGSGPRHRRGGAVPAVDAGRAGPHHRGAGRDALRDSCPRAHRSRR